MPQRLALQLGWRDTFFSRCDFTTACHETCLERVFHGLERSQSGRCACFDYRIGYSGHDHELPKLWIGESRYREVLCELRHGFRRRFFATTRSLPKPVSGTWPVSIARRGGARKYDREKHRDRVLDCGRNFSVSWTFLHQSLFQNEARASVHPSAVLTAAVLRAGRSCKVLNHGFASQHLSLRQVQPLTRDVWELASLVSHVNYWPSFWVYISDIGT